MVWSMVRRTWGIPGALCLGLAAFLACLDGGVAVAQSGDRVVTAKRTFAGKVVAVSPNDIDLEDRDGKAEKIPIDQVREVQFDDEPQSLRSARSMLLRGRSADALEEIGKVTPQDLEGAEQLLLDDIEFVKAAAAGRTALASGGNPADAGKLVNEFLTKHPKSHHFYLMQELLGNLLARAGKLENAQAAYAQVAKGPAAFKVRAASAKAAMFFDQKKYDEAFKEFENAISIEAGDDASLEQKRGAELGKARCLVQQGKQDQATELLQKVIKQADPEEKELLSRAYNVLGAAYRAAGGSRDQDALIAFLTVDLVYNSVPESHAEALFNLGELWERGKNPERAREARQSLETTYPGSPWTKKASSG